MSVMAGLITVEEYLTMPDPIGERTELHHGEVVLMPPPKPDHEDTQHRIYVLLARLAGPNWVVHVEMAFRPVPEYEVWRADVGCIPLQRHKARGNEYLMGAPELVV